MISQKLAPALISAAVLAAAGTTGFAAPPQFSKPLTITNPYLPLANLHQDILVGTANGKAARVERTHRTTTKRLRVGGQTVTAMIVEDRDFSGGHLEEDTLDYFVQADDGAVYYLGKSVDSYKNGKIVGHGGSWQVGSHGGKPGVLLPAHPFVGQKYQSENVPGIAVENDEILSLTETVTVPTGTYHHCLKVKEMADGEVEYKYYAPHVGVVKEAPPEGPMILKTHS